MKYGLLVFQGNHGKTTSRPEDGTFNVGDNIQMLAMRRIYRDCMGLQEEDLLFVDFHDLASYQGEPVVLPINFFFFGCKSGSRQWFPASPSIVPVFIGLHLDTQILDPDAVEYLRTYAPIGCRDAYTLHTMQKYHIPAYLGGCVTATLPHRANAPQGDMVAGGRVFLVDAPDELLPFIPPHLRSCCVRLSHERRAPFCEETFREQDALAAALLSRYASEAALVVTSRLHCATPCAAMGIPVVFAVKERSSRFAWIESLLPIYTPEEYDAIDWDPQPAEYEPMKKQMEDLVTKRLQEAYSRYFPLSQISEFFSGSVHGVYVDPLDGFKMRVMESNILEGYDSYILWGVTPQAQDVAAFLQEVYPQLKLCAVVDAFVVASFQGMQSIPPSRLREYPRSPIVVTSSSAYSYITKQIAHFGPTGPILFVYQPEILPPQSGDTSTPY